MEVRRCTQCGETRSAQDFYRGKSECKPCSRARSKQWRKRNPERVREQKRIEYERHPVKLRERSGRNYQANHAERLQRKAEYRSQRRDEIAAKQREYRAQNVEARREYDRDYVKRHAEAVAERVRQWRIDNPGYKHRPYLRREGDGFAAYARILGGDPCSYCGGPAGTLDHIDAIAAGGVNVWHNLTAACRPCNSKKRTAPLLIALLRF